MTPKPKTIENPRVRIAPSPTGFAHIGTGRTALFNWIIAKKYDGKFVLRLEDTDKARYKPEYETDLFEQLEWLGIDWDEGPEIGGLFGPYKQSERFSIYQKYIDQVLSEDKAYFCFCTAQELEAKKRDLESRGEPVKYDGHCRSLSKEDIQKLIDEGKSYVIRHKMPEKKVTFFDMVRDKIEFDLSLFGDQIIAKNNGQDPLYNFTNVIDDHEMKISHVIRGEEHLSNTPKQLALYDILNWQPPEFGHIPLILNSDRSKMSKRFGDVAIKDYRNKGYLPEALINFIVFLGWHPSEKPGQPIKEILTVKEIIKDFDFERVQKGGAIFNEEKLDWINNEYIKKLDIDKLVELIKPFLEKDLGKEKADSKMIEKIVLIHQPRLKRLSELSEMIGYFFDLTEYEKSLLFWKNIEKEDLKNNLDLSIDILSNIEESDFKEEKIKEILMPKAEERGRGEMLWPLRVALSGLEKSAGPFEILDILGKKESLRRLEIARKKLHA